MAETVPVVNLPQTFCIKTNLGNRQGYFLMRWSQGVVDPNGRPIHIIKGYHHQNRFYPFQNYNVNTTQYHTTMTMKGSGRVSREARWKFTGTRLRYEDARIPILIFTNGSSVLPNMKIDFFIPIRDPITPTVATVPIVPIVPIVPNRIFPIKTIPTHIVRAILRDAAMQEEVCPITSEELDVTNGAITSCFHLFERDAIMRWLLMPSSEHKCPVCKCPCESFTLDEPPRLDMTV